MALTSAGIAHSPLTLPLLRRQSSLLLESFLTNPRLASIFTTQQRWLLAHATIGLCLREGGTAAPSMTLAQFLAEVERHKIASRNTADAFIKGMLHYGYMQSTPNPDDKRSRMLSVAHEPQAMFRAWTSIHLLTLDRFDGNARLEKFEACEEIFAPLGIAIARGVLTDATIRQPRRTFSLFTWLNNGGVIMDWLISNLGEISADGHRYATPISSIAEISAWTRLSRTHLTRKLREAEAIGSMGWTDEKLPTMWVSSAFVEEMIEAQAAKLAVIDAAWDEALAGRVACQ
jgi:DNA-binding MarR family transcriptional regulator